MKRKVLIVVDMQNDFISGCLGTKEAQAIVSPMADFIKKWIEDGGIVIFTQDTHDASYLNTQEGKRLPVGHCFAGTTGWKVVDTLEKYQNMDSVHTITKATFGSLDLAECIKEITEDAGCDEVEVYFCGVCTGICVISNAVATKIVMPEARIAIISDLCACVTPESHQTALDAMRTLQMDIIKAETA